MTPEDEARARARILDAFGVTEDDLAALDPNGSYAAAAAARDTLETETLRRFQQEWDRLGEQIRALGPLEKCWCGAPQATWLTPTGPAIVCSGDPRHQQ